MKTISELKDQLRFYGCVVSKEYGCVRQILANTLTFSFGTATRILGILNIYLFLVHQRSKKLNTADSILHTRVESDA